MMKRLRAILVTHFKWEDTSNNKGQREFFTGRFGMYYAAKDMNDMLEISKPLFKKEF